MKNYKYLEIKLHGVKGTQPKHFDCIITSAYPKTEKALLMLLKKQGIDSLVGFSNIYIDQYNTTSNCPLKKLQGIINPDNGKIIAYPYRSLIAW